MKFGWKNSRKRPILKSMTEDDGRSQAVGERGKVQSKFMNLGLRLGEFVQLIADLRGENGCSWDREQTHKSLTSHLIEEAYEVVDAIRREDETHLKEELGDVLLQVVLHAQIASENGAFSLEDVIESIFEKIVRRHPHIFLGETALSKDEAKVSWRAAKESEGKDPLEGLSSVLPSFIFSSKVQSVAKRAGFDWPDAHGVIDKLYEEIAELKEETSTDKVASELGDILFTVVNLAGHLKVDPEMALKAATVKFKRRFIFMINRARQDGLDFEALSLKQKESLWSLAKEES